MASLASQREQKQKLANEQFIVHPCNCSVMTSALTENAKRRMLHAKRRMLPKPTKKKNCRDRGFTTPWLVPRSKVRATKTHIQGFLTSSRGGGRGIKGRHEKSPTKSSVMEPSCTHPPTHPHTSYTLTHTHTRTHRLTQTHVSELVQSSTLCNHGLDRVLPSVIES